MVLKYSHITKIEKRMEVKYRVDISQKKEQKEKEKERKKRFKMC